MAIRLDTTYPGQTNVADASYPQGSAKNVSAPSAGDGTPFEKTWVNDVLGFLQALLNAGGSTPSGTPDTALVSQYFDGMLAAVGSTPVANFGVGTNTLAGIISNVGVWASTEAEIQAANDLIVASGSRKEIQIVPGAFITLSAGLVLDADHVTLLDGNGALLLGSGFATTTTGIMVTSSASPGVIFSPVRLRGFSMQGPGKTVTASIGVLVSGAARVVFDGVVIADFPIGIRNESPSRVPMKNCEIYNCGTAFDLTFGTVGDLDLSAPIISNCDLVFSQSGASRRTQVFGGVLEDNAQILTLNEGVIGFQGTRVEAVDYTSTPFTLSNNNSIFTMVGGSLVVTGSSMSAAYWADVYGDSLFTVRGTRLENTVTSGGAFSTGAGKTVLRETVFADATKECGVLTRDHSRVIDGGFENILIKDNLFITGDAHRVITDRLIGTDIQLISITAEARSGSRSLEVVTPSGVSTDIAFVLAAVPVQPFDHIGGEVYWKHEAGGSWGSFDLKFFFATLQTSSEGIPEILIRGTETTETLAISIIGSSWALQSVPQGVNAVAPEWATHFVIEFDGALIASPSAGSVYFDDLNLNVVG